MADNILEMRSITKTFPGVKALENVNLDVRRGEIHAICGENGAGKSTLMKVLSGVYPTGSYDGEIVYDGTSAHFSNIRDSEHVGIVIIHQELALVPYLSIAAPSNTIDPVSGDEAPEAIFISVDLPAPFSPRSACTSPASTSNETSVRAATPS